jgi:hypothetical protein
MRVTLKAINDALAERGENVRLLKGTGYYYFDQGEAVNWLDKTVNSETLSTRTLEQWIDEFERLKKLNQQLFGEPDKPPQPATPKTAARRRAKPK